MKAIIIDDEKNSREVIAILIQKYAPEVEVIGQYSSGKEALAALNAGLSPDIVFLDIQMQGMNGFDFLNECQQTDFYVIFTTAYNEYAIKAIKHHAFDYLLKPIQRQEFIQTIERVKLASKDSNPKLIKELLHSLSSKTSTQKITISTQDGIYLFDVNDIVYIKGDGAYSKYFITDGSKVMVSKVLKEADTSLPKSIFVRVHASYLVNLNHIARYTKGEGGMVIMKDGTNIPISRSRKANFLSMLKNLKA